MKKKQKTLVATVISRLFDPVWLIPLLLTAAVFWSVANGLRWRFLVMLIMIDGLIPFAYFEHLLRTHEISDWDTTKRTERFQLYGFTIFVHFVGIAVAVLLGKIVLAKLLFSFWILAVIFFLITLRWKISLHTGVSSAVAAFAVFVFGPRWLFLYMIVACIAWARVAMKKHTLAQAIVGAVLASLVMFLMFSILGVTAQSARQQS